MRYALPGFKGDARWEPWGSQCTSGHSVCWVFKTKSGVAMCRTNEVSWKQNWRGQELGFESKSNVWLMGTDASVVPKYVNAQWSVRSRTSTIMVEEWFLCAIYAHVDVLELRRARVARPSRPILNFSTALHLNFYISACVTLARLPYNPSHILPARAPASSKFSNGMSLSFHACSNARRAPRGSNIQYYHLIWIVMVS